MMILGQTSCGMKQLVDSEGQRVAHHHRPMSCYLGVASEEVIAQRLWVDAALDDDERLLFIKSQLNQCVISSIDYEIVQHDADRVLLHAYALREPIKHRFTAIETQLHGLARALRRLYAVTDVIQCLCIYDDAVELSIHLHDSIFYMTRETYTEPTEMIFALRRAQQNYFISEPIRYDHSYYLNFSKHQQFHSAALIETDTSLVIVDSAWLTWLIPYGVACRGLQHD